MCAEKGSGAFLRVWYTALWSRTSKMQLAGFTCLRGRVLAFTLPSLYLGSDRDSASKWVGNGRWPNWWKRVHLRVSCLLGNSHCCFRKNPKFIAFGVVHTKYKAVSSCHGQRPLLSQLWQVGYPWLVCWTVMGTCHFTQGHWKRSRGQNSSIYIFPSI